MGGALCRGHLSEDVSRHATDFFLEHFNMSPEHSQALQAVHGAVHAADVGVKYSWFGAGYISNM